MKYKTINLDEQTFMLLDRVSSRLAKSKAGTVSYLLDIYEKEQEVEDRKKTEEFHRKMDELRSKISLPPGTKVDSVELANDLYLAYEDEVS